MQAEEDGLTLVLSSGQLAAVLQTGNLAGEPKIPAAASWTSVRVAENAINDSLRANKQVIEQWAKAGGKGNLRLGYPGSSPIGSGVVRASGKLEAMSNARIILKRTQQAGHVWFVLTAFPEP